ncbi:MAG: hypothetical protein MUF61_01785, partial [archaeon]|nr:hypothetical protein [archaeon]
MSEAKKDKKKHLPGYFLFSFIWLILKFLWFIIKIPYYLARGFYKFIKWSAEKTAKAKISSKRASMKPVFEDFKVVKTIGGSYPKFLESVSEAESKIGIIIGARGSGKTAFGIKFLENLHTKTAKHCYAIGFKEEDFPSWINVVQNVSEIKNDSIVLVDEGGILFSSRKSMSAANQYLS